MKLDPTPLFRIAAFRLADTAPPDFDGAFAANGGGTLAWHSYEKLSVEQLAALLNVQERTVYRWHKDGMTVAQASKACDRIRVHPTEVWGNSYSNLVMAGAA